MPPSRSASCSTAWTDFLDGFKEVRLNSARSVDLFDDAVEVSRAAANIKIGTQVQTFRQIVSVQSYMYVLLGAVVFAAPRFSESFGRRFDSEGHDGAAVRCRGLFRPGAIDTDPDERECRGGPAAEISVRPECDRFDRAGRNGGTAGFRCDRDAQYRVPLRGQIFRHRLPHRAHRLHAAIRRACLHHRRQRLGKVDPAAGACRALSARFRRDHARRNADQQPHARHLSLVDSPRFFSTIICFTGSTAYPIRIRSRSTGC